jgi:hypothetical protein
VTTCQGVRQCSLTRWRLLVMDRRPSISLGPIAISSTEDLFVALFSCALKRAARSPRARQADRRRWEPPARSEPALDHPDVRTSRLLTSSRRADSDELVGDASSKCKEAGGAQDRIIHNGDDDGDGGSCRGPFTRTPWKGWGKGGTASPILCPTMVLRMTMDRSLPVQGTGGVCSSWRGGGSI